MVIGVVTLRQQYAHLPKICFGFGTLSFIEETLQRFRGEHLLVISDRQHHDTNLLEKIERMAENDEIQIHIHITESSELELGASGPFFCFDRKFAGIVAFGGMKLLNYAKWKALEQANEGDVLEKLMRKEPLQKGIPLISIPMTITTGIEASPHVFSIRKDEITFVTHPFFTPSLVIYDPNLTIASSPYERSALGLLNLANSLESYFLLQQEPFLERLTLKAIKLILTNMLRVTYKKRDLSALEALVKASMLNGIVQHASPLRHVFHSFVQPLLQHGRVPYEIATSVMLPYVIELFQKKHDGRGQNIVRELGFRINDDRQVYTYLKARIANMIRTIGFPNKLSALPIRKADLSSLAEKAYNLYLSAHEGKTAWTEKDFLKIYENAYSGKIKSFYHF